MRGIDEETLLAVRKSLAAEGLNTDAVDALISLKIRELNPWLPIDENAPKDRRLNLYWKGYGWFTGQWRMGQYFCDAGLMVPVNIKPTHYQELPDDPEQGDANARNT